MLFAGACYDTVNNMLWTCSNDYIDQWCNPGNQAFHYVCQRLGVSHIITEPKGEQHFQLPNITNYSGSIRWECGLATDCIHSFHLGTYKLKPTVVHDRDNCLLGRRKHVNHVNQKACKLVLKENLYVPPKI